MSGFAARVHAARASRDTLCLFWLGEAGFALSGSGTTLLIDPFLIDEPDRLASPPCTATELAFADAVLATHEHRRHLDVAAWSAIAAQSDRPRFVVPAPLVGQVVGLGIPAERVLGAAPDGAVQLGAARVTPVPARHGVHASDAYNFGRELSGGLQRYLGYVVELSGVRVYHSGDTIGYDGQVERLRELRIDLALLPINGRDVAREARDFVGNLDAREAADLAAQIGADAIVPMHYELYADNPGDPAALVAYARERHPQLTVVVLGRHGSLVHRRA